MLILFAPFAAIALSAYFVLHRVIECPIHILSGVTNGLGGAKELAGPLPWNENFCYVKEKTILRLGAAVAAPSRYIIFRG